MTDLIKRVCEFRKEKDFLACIDSDGCAFDAMNIKHQECFIPNIINTFGLQPISRYAREASEFVNLYSKWRGTNRFPALVKTFELLAEREEVIKRGFRVPDLKPLKEWIERETKLGNPALEKAVDKTGDPVLKQTLEWSKAGNADVARIVKGVPLFPYVRESLEKASGQADVLIVSSTPLEALEREWKEHGVDKYVRAICGQEVGTKSQCINMAKAGRYPDEKVIKIGDALSDLQAARENNVLFYPIVSGKEDESWQRFFEEALERFIGGEYAGGYEKRLIEEFESNLSEHPPWKAIR